MENEGWYLSRLFHGRVRLETDGSFLVTSQYHIWHWNRDGYLINRIGGKGEGPGEFESLGEVLWNGEYYWAIDGARLVSSVFDRAGRFLSMTPVYYRQFVRVEEQLFMIDTTKFQQQAFAFYPVLQEVRYAINEGHLTVNHTDLLFKKVSRRQMDFNFNFKLLWVLREGDGYLVVDQLEPKIWVYDSKTIVLEKSTGVEDPFQPRAIPMQARLWAEPPPKYTDRVMNTSDFTKWWCAWSRITLFERAAKDYLLAYEVPDPDDPENTRQVIQRIAKSGRALGEPLLVEGFCMGVWENQAYVFWEDPNTENFRYLIRVYDF